MEGSSPARLYCLLVGGVLVVAGIIGFFYEASFAVGDEVVGEEVFGILAVNGWHNLVHIAIGGLQLRARIDRIDRLDDGRLVVIDYKSTAPALSAWEGDRPDEPQLPMYAVSSGTPPSAVAFAQVQTGNCFFRGFGAEPTPLDGLKAARMEDVLGEWRAALSRLAGQFRDGFAPVDPKDHDTCTYCRLHSLCRIHESE